MHFYFFWARRDETRRGAVAVVRWPASLRAAVSGRARVGDEAGRTT